MTVADRKPCQRRCQKRQTSAHVRSWRGESRNAEHACFLRGKRRRAVIGKVGASISLAAAFSAGCATSGGVIGRVARSAGVPWTILCMEMQGPFSRDHIDQFADTLKRTPGVRAGDVQILHDDDGFSRIYYGTYFRRSDRRRKRPEIPKAMRQDLRLIQELVGARGERFFARARMVRRPEPDAGNPDWSLTRASGVYTLQVAAFEPTDDLPEPKKAAAQYCDWLRSKGYEAYYHHGPACSIVTVGMFDESAVDETQPGLGYYSEQVRKLQQDELLKYNIVNGAVIRTLRLEFGDLEAIRAMSPALSKKQNRRTRGVPVPSSLVRIPNDRANTAP